MKKLICTIATLTAISGTIPTQAHHSFSATFTQEVITVEGVVNRVSFTNPHVMVYFDVTDENGEVTEWSAEGRAATSMRASGWSRDTLAKGDHISITGNSTRNGSPMVSIDEVNLRNPQTGELLGDPSQESEAKEEAFSTSISMTLADGRPNLSGAWVQNPIVPGVPSRRPSSSGGPNGMGGPPTGMGGPPGGMGAPPGGTGVPPRFQKSPNTIDLPGGFLHDEKTQLNAEAAKLQANFDAKNDPQVQCQPPGLVRQSGVTPHPFSIQQFDDRVEFAYEEYGGKRTVYFDDRDLIGGEVSRFGQSIARYEGDALVIDTTHVSGAWATPFGPTLSDQTTTKERYSRLEDENGVSMIASHMIVDDPDTLTAPFNLYRYKYNAENYEFIEVDCHVPLSK